MLPGHVVLFPHRRLCELLRSLGFGVCSQRPTALRFSLDYWLASVGEYLPGVTLVRRGLRMAGLDRLTVPVNLLDERVVVATKLESERAEPAPSGLVMPIQTAQGTFQAAGVRLRKGFAAWTLLAPQRPGGAAAAARRLSGATVPGPSASREYGATRKACLLRAIEHDAAAVVMLQAENDYDLSPSYVLAKELEKLGKPHKLSIHPPHGTSVQDGHGGFCFRAPAVWGADVLSFLDTYLKN